MIVKRKFASKIVAGETATASYFASFPRCKSKSTAEQEGCKLLKNPKIAASIQELRERDEAILESDRIATQRELLEFLTKTISTTPPAEVHRRDKASPLAIDIPASPARPPHFNASEGMPFEDKALPTTPSQRSNPIRASDLHRQPPVSECPCQV